MQTFRKGAAFHAKARAGGGCEGVACSGRNWEEGVDFTFRCKGREGYNLIEGLASP